MCALLSAMVVSGEQMTFTPPARAIWVSPLRRLPQATCTGGSTFGPFTTRLLEWICEEGYCDEAGFLDLLTVKFVTGFGQRPQHLLGAVGLISFSIGAVTLGILTSRWIVDRLLAVEQPIHLHQRAIFYYSLVALILGAQFIATGLLAELITSWRNRDDADYSLVERVGDKQAWQTTDALIQQERRPNRLTSAPVRSGDKLTRMES